MTRAIGTSRLDRDRLVIYELRVLVVRPQASKSWRGRGCVVRGCGSRVFDCACVQTCGPAQPSPANAQKQPGARLRNAGELMAVVQRVRGMAWDGEIKETLVEPKNSGAAAPSWSLLYTLPVLIFAAALSRMTQLAAVCENECASAPG